VYILRALWKAVRSAHPRYAPGKTMIGHDWMTAAAIEMSVDPKVDASFVEEYKDGLVIGLEVIGLIALVADIFALVVS
jgi:hypothetical protein